MEFSARRFSISKMSTRIEVLNVAWFDDWTLNDPTAAFLELFGFLKVVFQDLALEFCAV